MTIRCSCHPLRLVLCAVALLAFAAVAAAAEFSADLIGTIDGKAVAGKLYVKGTSARQEMSQGTRTVIIIARQDEKIAWIINPFNKAYMELKGDAVPGLGTLAEVKVPSEVGTRKLVGKEKVNGYVCDKYVLIFKDKRRGTEYQWVSRKLKAPLKTQLKAGNHVTTMEIKNIKEGKLASSLFELPKGYRKVEIPKTQAVPGQAPLAPKAGASK